MNSMESTLALPSRLGARPQPRSAGAVLALLERIEHGTLEIRLPDGSQHRFGQTGPVAATLEVADWSMFDRILERGDVGFADAWIDGDWHSPDLAGLLTLLANNRQGLARAVYGQWWSLLTARLRHWLNANTAVAQGQSYTIATESGRRGLMRGNARKILQSFLMI